MLTEDCEACQGRVTRVEQRHVPGRRTRRQLCVAGRCREIPWPRGVARAHVQRGHVGGAVAGQLTHMRRLGERAATGCDAFQVLQLHALCHGGQGIGMADGVAERRLVLLHRVEPVILLHFEVIQHRGQVRRNRVALAAPQLLGGPLAATSRSSPARPARDPDPKRGGPCARSRPRSVRLPFRRQREFTQPAVGPVRRHSSADPGPAAADRPTCGASRPGCPPRPLGRDSDPHRSRTPRRRSGRCTRDKRSGSRKNAPCSHPRGSRAGRCSRTRCP